MARLPTVVSAALDNFHERLRTRFTARLADVRLFGSYARGEARPDSDVDVLVVVRDLVERERREAFELAEEVYFDSLIRVAPLALSTAEFEALNRRELLIASEIARDGVRL